MSLVNLAQVKGTKILKNDVQKMLTSYDALKQTCEANKAYVDKKVADLVNGAPEQLDTLQELSKALNNDKDYAATVNNALAEKLGKTEKAVSAETADRVPWTGVTGKPSTYPPSAHTHGLINSDFTALVGGDEDDTWGAIGINAGGHVLKSIRVNKVAPDWLLANYSAGIAFGGEDTRGVISAAYDVPKVKFAGGNGNKPNWYYSLLGTSGKEYNLDNYLPLSGGAMTATEFYQQSNGKTLSIQAGADDLAGSSLFLINSEVEDGHDIEDKGAFGLRTSRKGSSNNAAHYFIGRPNGTLVWDNIDLAGAGIVSQQLSKDASYIKYANGLLVQFGTMLVQGYAGARAYIKTLPISFKEVYSMQATLGYPCAREVSSVQIESDLTYVKLWIYNFVSSSDSVTTFYGHWLMIGTWK